MNVEALNIKDIRDMCIDKILDNIFNEKSWLNENEVSSLILNWEKNIEFFAYYNRGFSELDANIISLYKINSFDKFLIFKTSFNVLKSYNNNIFPNLKMTKYYIH